MSVNSEYRPPEMDNMAGNDEMLGQEDASIQLVGSVQEQVPKPPPERSRPELNRRKSYTPYLEDKLARRLKFHFMGPHEKIKARRKIPWKLLIQITKIILVTAQLIQFGYARSSFVEYTESNTVSLKHLYLKDWTNSYETMPYPPAIGKYAIYEIGQVEAHINYAMKQYNLTEKIAVGSLRFHPNSTYHPISMCVKHYTTGLILDNDTYNIDSHVQTTVVFENISTTAIVTNCTTVGPYINTTTGEPEYDITKYLAQNNKSLINYDRLLVLSLNFSLTSFRLDIDQRDLPPQCFKVDVQIDLDDSNKDGEMFVTLSADLMEFGCSGHFSTEDREITMRNGLVSFDSIVMVITVLSILLCSRSVWRAQKLRLMTMRFFRHRYGKPLSVSDQLEFLNFWYVAIIINDILTIVGSGYKIQLEIRNLTSSSDNYDVCGILLGTGSLLAWLGVLRYIGFFQRFNILIVTLKKAFPNMLRFLVCCMMLYIGFVICGWVVLGPYHIKFRKMSTASECLYSLINGDDMFVTFSATMTKNNLIWYYSRIYLYTFISLFIYAVLNLFIAVILEAYDTIKTYYNNPESIPKSELYKFMDRCTDPAHSAMYRKEDTSCNPMTAFCCCFDRYNPDKPNEYTSLVGTI